jgi:hypothetical protein
MQLHLITQRKKHEEEQPFKTTPTSKHKPYKALLTVALQNLQIKTPSIADDPVKQSLYVVHCPPR